MNHQIIDGHQDCYFVRTGRAVRRTQEDREDYAAQMLCENPYLTRDTLAERIDLTPEHHCPSCGCRCGWNTADCNETPGDKCGGQVKEIEVVETRDSVGKVYNYPVHACEVHAPLLEQNLLPNGDPFQRYVAENMQRLWAEQRA